MKGNETIVGHILEAPPTHTQCLKRAERIIGRMGSRV